MTYRFPRNQRRNKKESGQKRSMYDPQKEEGRPSNLEKAVAEKEKNK
jgi:hypothetical protein